MPVDHIRRVMADSDITVPRPNELETWYQLTDVRIRDDRIIYYGEPLVSDRRLIRELWPAFQAAGYELKLAKTEADTDTALVAIPHDDRTNSEGLPWTNIILFGLTLLSTQFVGAVYWYYVPLEAVLSNPLAMLEAWPFTAAVLGVLLTHELGHYVMGRYHGVDVSLPYLIPFPTIFGTMGAVIRMRGRMPSRKALFDIGVSGPIAGLVATVVVTVIGLSLGPVEVPEQLLEQSQTGESMVINSPPLLDIIASLLGANASYSDPALNPHPVIFGGWVGMFFTWLNLLPVGQLDGGHMVRAMVGKRQETIAALVPGALFGLAGYLYFVRDLTLNESVILWLIWGLFTLVIAYNGPATPVDEQPIDRGRVVVGLLTFGVGLLCFMIVPFELQ